MSTKILDYHSWIGKWPLGPFEDKLSKLDPQKLKGSKRYKLVLMGFRALLWDILNFLRYIGFIIKRLNDNFLKCLNPDLTPKRGIEFARTGGFGNIWAINVDLISFIFFSRILMDKISRLLFNIVDGGNKPSSKSFQDWRKKIGKYDGEGLGELRKIIENADWFDELKTLRDDYIVHHGFQLAHIAVSENQLGMDLRSSSKEKEVFYTIESIQKLSQKMYEFLEDLNKFLCDNFDLLPIRITKIADLR